MKTLQTTLFISFSFVFIFIIILINGFFITYTRNILLSQSIDELKEISLAISSDLDSEIEELDRVSMNIAYSEMVNQSFQEFHEFGNRANHKPLKELIAAAIAIVGPQSTVKQIYLYSRENLRISVGMRTTVEAWVWAADSWFGDVNMADGQKVLTGPVKDESLSQGSPYQSNRYNLLLRRLFFDRYGNSVGIMELVKDSEDIFASAKDYHRRSDSHVFVLNSQDRIIYPIDTSGESSFSLSDFPSENGNLTGSYYTRYNGEFCLLAYTYSIYTGWTTVLVQEKRHVLAETNRFTLIMAAVIFPVLLIVLFVSYLVSRRVTKPLATIHRFIDKMNLIHSENRMPGDALPLNELDELNQALGNMHDKLRKSHTETLEAHRHEAEARMQALQAQVNPHFMHNTINTISAMAEEGMNKDIVTMCLNISQMMRYISDQNQTVSLENEINYTKSYLDTMKLRFREKLKYTLDIQGDPGKVLTPRLIIQPLAENAIKHGTKRRHPWIIGISVFVGESSWRVTLKDNGPGFTNEMARILNGWTPEEEHGNDPGVGLININRRLYLRYGGSGYEFEIGNSDEGAMVTIGGSIEAQMKQGREEPVTNE